MIPEVELHSWRAIRALTVLSILVTMLMLGGQAVSMLKAILPTPTPTATTLPPVALVPEVSQPQAGQSSTASSVAPVGVRVQTFAEIVPGTERKTASAWADGAMMRTQSVATGSELRAEAAAAWPEDRNLPTAAPQAIALTPTQVGNFPAPTPTSPSAPVFVPSVPLANVRGGPGTSYQIVGTINQGRSYAIVGRYRGNEGQWWEVDTGNGFGWVYDGVGTATGSMVNVPTNANFAPLPTPNPTATALPTATPAAVKPVFAYSAELKRHPEANTVSFYARIQDGQSIGGGLYLWVTHNGKTYRSEPSSHLISGMTKPGEPSSPYNDNYNAKIDFPAFIYHDVDPVGEWTVTLVDGNNQALSDTTRLQVTAGDSMKEFFFIFRKG